eukprot:CAMPEP_0114552816 /NCGR_PEP_ID=MMETSP0114-20121206/7323_1 /TAXON_ID=31324 /ORGANISM="Goniomonas sp, Strain m" /LENGTH=651 /DNA_ID=CAMNT_0001737711 /DNA_START=13 /DNA_END=1968 /DNA_ORIENTATION=-
MQRLVFVALLCLHAATAFYLPGVAPRVYKRGESLNIKVQTLTSSESQLQFDYYQLPFCAPAEEIEYAENLGEALLGEKSVSSAYHANVMEDRKCSVLCRKVYDAKDMEEFQDFSILNYHVNMRADNLPLAEVRNFVYSDDPSGNPLTVYALGYPLGVMEETPEGHDLYYLNNHLRFKILYHPVEVTQENLDPHGVFIVGFHVEPYSVHHTYQGEWNETCGSNCPLETCVGGNVLAERQQISAEHETTEVVWTYDVVWEESAVKWASRWDIYLEFKNDNIHWFSVVNSALVLMFLTAIIAMIMTRILRKDFAMYNEVATTDDESARELREETGWKLVYGDVFRAPAMPMLLTVLIGTGLQLFCMVVATLVFAVLGFLSPANRGALLSCILIFFVALGSVSGFVAARFCKLFKETNQFRCTLMTGLLFPGTIFALFFVINLFVWSQGSSGAVPFGTMVALMALWLGISLPLVFFGSYLGFKREGYTVPTRTNPIPRQIPPQVWYLRSGPACLMAGVLPFGVVFVELAVILGSIWQHRFYYMFGFLFLVFIILVITIIEVSIVLVYLQLCAENYNWWWRSFFSGGSMALYIFLYSVYYYTRHVHLVGLGGLLSCVIFIGYAFIVCLTLFVLCGFTSVMAAFFFNRVIYGSVKID